MTRLRSFGPLLMAALLLAAGCASSDPGGVGVGGGGDNRDVPAQAVNDALTALEEFLNAKLSPQMTVDWRFPLTLSRGVRQVWLTPSEVIVEDARRIINGIDRTSGKSGFQFQLDFRNDAPDRVLAWPPARTESLIHMICSDGTFFTIDRFGNLEYNSILDFEASGPPTGTDQFLLVGSQTRFFYAWDAANRRYEKRSRLAEIAKAAPVVHKNRVYIASNDGGVYSLSLEPRDFFDTVWEKKSFGEVASPLCVNGEANHLYVATQNSGVVNCYSLLNGEIEWSVSTECSISADMLVDTSYSKDRMYVITEGSENQEINGLWCIRTVDPEKRDQGTKLWVFKGANKILALGKNHMYVRSGSPGAYKIALVRTADGTLEREFAVDPRFDLWLTNPHGPQIVLGSNWLHAESGGRVGLFFSVAEPQ